MCWISANWFDLVSLLFLAIGGVWSLLNWRYSARTRRAEWLSSLYARFFEDERFKATRIKLDYGSTEELDALYDGLRRDDPGVSEDIVGYLNFFEFVAGLHKMNQVTLKELELLFDYYLRLLNEEKHSQIREFISKQGFEQLDRLLRKFPFRQ